MAKKSTPLYVYKEETDCDMCTGYSVHEFKNRKAFDKWYDKVMEWREGPVHVEEISKQQYDEFNAEPMNSRDRAFEAYENGNGSSIYV